MSLHKKWAASCALAAICMLSSTSFTAHRNLSLEQEDVVIVYPQRHMRGEEGVAGWEGAAQLQGLWGGAGKVVTGTSVDGRRTVPGLHTDCVPGVLSSDCSPAQVGAPSPLHTRH